MVVVTELEKTAGACDRANSGAGAGAGAGAMLMLVRAPPKNHTHTHTTTHTATQFEVGGLQRTMNGVLPPPPPTTTTRRLDRVRGGRGPTGSVPCEHAGHARAGRREAVPGPGGTYPKVRC
jgi:hypothetical protein